MLEMNIVNQDLIDTEFLIKNNVSNPVDEIIDCCFVCNEYHKTESCPVFDNLNHIEDTEVLPRALLTLPQNLKVETLADGSKTVFAQDYFFKGTQFGPYQAERVYSFDPFNSFPLRVFENSHNTDYYFDFTNDNQCNWMGYVAPAQNVEEQNLICYQINFNIYYSIIRDIKPGEQLKVWYSKYYAQKMGKDILKTDIKEPIYDAEKIQCVVENLPAKKLGALEKQNWICKRCGQIETNVVKFAKHVQKHYLNMIKNSFVCNICNAGFSTEKNLLKHRKYNHTALTDHKPNDYDLNKSETPKQDLIETCIPLQVDNLMPVNLTDSDQLLMLESLNLMNSSLYNDLNEVDPLEDILSDNNIKASNASQEKSIEDFSLELVENNSPKLSSPYECDICNKKFSNLRNLCCHLKKHTGEFTCMKCLEVFTRKENYTTHYCFRENVKMWYNCSYCPKTFTQKKYLSRHMVTHVRKHICIKCGNRYNSLKERKEHNCSAIPDVQKKIYPCDICNQKFFRELYLKRHKSRCHSSKAQSNIQTTVICEICAKMFLSTNALLKHKLIHLETRFECEICSKKFYRKDLYNNHLKSHDSKLLFSCEICDKKFKLKKSLATHIVSHQKSRYKCDQCGGEFSQKANLNKHKLNIHNGNLEICPHCQKVFKNKSVLSKHMKTIHSQQELLYECKICDKKFKTNSMLTKHMLKHNDKLFSCLYCSHVCKYKNSLVRHLDKNHSEQKQEWNDPNILNNCVIDKNEVPKEPKLTSESNENENLCAKTDQEITLQKNAFILENGTIVQPQEGGGIMFYIINQPINKE